MNNAYDIIQEFTEQIESCIRAADWQQLETLLISRQQYFEQVFRDPRDIKSDDLIDLKALAQAILEQDTLFQTQIEQQKAAAYQEQHRIGQGRRAIAAYL